MYYDKFDYLAGLNIHYQGTSKESAIIYGNGLNMIEVIVKVKIMDGGTNSTPPRSNRDDE